MRAAAARGKVVRMNVSNSSTRDRRRRRLEADLAARVEAVFRDWPELAGFTVQEETPEPLSLVQYGPLDQAHADAMIGAVTRMMHELVDEEPEAPALLLGRTFARVLH